MSPDDSVQSKLPKTLALPGKMPTPVRPERRTWWGLTRFWWAVLFFLAIVALATGLETSLLQTISRREAILEILSRLAPWLFMTGLIIRISSKYTMDAGNWRRVIWIYLAAFVLSLAVVAMFTYFGPPPALLASQHPHSNGLFGDPRSRAFVMITRMTMQTPTFWGLVAVAHAVRFYEREDTRKLHEAELRAQLIQARLHALQLQLNPHFLFNTLNSIASLVQDNPAAAEQMIEALGDLLRVATTTHRQKVTVREELHFLEQYLLIQRIRFGDRLQIESVVDNAILDEMVPVLILQPLMENAIKHGVETHLQPCQVRLLAQPAGGGHFLRLEITNSGPAMEVFGRKIEERIGLSNTRARLQTMFGDRASLELYPHPQGGFVARILVPLQAAPPQSKSPEIEAAA